jgi:erythronate-4-phosphate dehydrogenase
MLRIIADENIPYLKGVLEPFAEIIYLPGTGITRNSVQNADALLVRTRTNCNDLLLHGTRVNFIATATIGFDHIDTHYCEANNIHWENAPGCNSSSVQQYLAIALIHLKQAGKLNVLKPTLGVVGVGHVGTKVASIAESLGFNVLLNDPPRERIEGTNSFIPLQELLSQSDVISLHVPLIKTGEDKTLHLFDKYAFGNMKPGVCLINTSRGDVIEETALTSFINTGNLSALILDVWEKEPLINIQLLNRTFIGTPHIAGYSADGKANATSMVVQALSHHFGLPLTDWFPENIAKPAKPLIEIDGYGKDIEEILAGLLPNTYDIFRDHEFLRASPETFEKQRANYPLRREFSAYSVHGRNLSIESEAVIRQMGFQLSQF